MRTSTLLAIGQGLMGGITLLWLGSVGGKLFEWFFQARRETKEKGKQIELGAMVAAGIATLISLAALGFAIYGQVDADARITKLEQAAKAAPAPSAKPDQQEPRQ